MNIEEQAKLAFYKNQKEIRDKAEQIKKRIFPFEYEYQKKAFDELRKKLPDLVFDEHEKCFKLGKYKFRAKAVGTYVDTGENSYALESVDDWECVTDMVSFGRFIIKQEKNLKKPQKIEKTKKWFNFLR